MRIQCLPEKGDIILVIGAGWIRRANDHARRRRVVLRIRRLRIVLKGFMMRDIVGLRVAVGTDMRLGWIGEASLEPTPGEPFGVKQVTNVFALHRESRSA